MRVCNTATEQQLAVAPERYRAAAKLRQPLKSIQAAQGVGAVRQGTGSQANGMSNWVIGLAVGRQNIKRKKDTQKGPTGQKGHRPTACNNRHGRAIRAG